ncbi:MAG: thiamine-phosphate kinase [Desulfobacterales bacterium]|nr:thiamine-phosphate kinase [Desulfobacterales bacterium]
MILKEIGEFGFIRRVSRGCLVHPEHVVKAIGDDAAAFEPEVGHLTLVTTDLLVERVHFLRQAASGADLGYKSLAVNLSDIAAMGGNPVHAFISIAIPDDCDLEYLDDFYDGLKSLAAEFDVNVLGGDTTRSKTDLIVNIMVVGVVTRECLLTRDAARPGDLIFATGCLGNSKAGLQLILDDAKIERQDLKYLYATHIRPRPHVREGQFLSLQTGVRSAIDVSDGLSNDIGHICQESQVGVCLFAEKIPISPELLQYCTDRGFNPVDWALSGGEDYVLLCTIASDSADQARTAFQKRFNTPLYQIGEINDSNRMQIVQTDGRILDFVPSGWDHFKTTS